MSAHHKKSLVRLSLQDFVCETKVKKKVYVLVFFSTHPAQTYILIKQVGCVSSDLQFDNERKAVQLMDRRPSRHF